MSRRYVSRAWALLIRTPAAPPALPKAEQWLAGRYCFGHDSPPYLEGLRIGCFATRREARKAAEAWGGPRGERARPVPVVVSVVEAAAPPVKETTHD